MVYKLKQYRKVMVITNSDYHAVASDGRWEIYNDHTLLDYADNRPIAKAKLLDKFEAVFGIEVSDEQGG